MTGASTSLSLPRSARCQSLVSGAAAGARSVWRSATPTGEVQTSNLARAANQRARHVQCRAGRSDGLDCGHGRGKRCVCVVCRRVKWRLSQASASRRRRSAWSSKTRRSQCEARHDSRVKQDSSSSMMKATLLVRCIACMFPPYHHHATCSQPAPSHTKILPYTTPNLEPAHLFHLPWHGGWPDNCLVCVPERPSFLPALPANAMDSFVRRVPCQHLSRMRWTAVLQLHAHHLKTRWLVRVTLSRHRHSLYLNLQ